MNGSPLKIIAPILFAPYFVFGFALLIYSALARPTAKFKKAYPTPISFFGPACWGYAFSARYQDANDNKLTWLVLVWRASIVLLPFGIIALFAST
jgi:hypothetical protein